MSWDNKAWERRDQEVESLRAEQSIFFPPRDRSGLQAEMDNYLIKRSLLPSTAERFGWYPAHYHGPRIIIPCIRTDYKNFWQGRLIEGRDNRRTPDGEGQKRWDSPHGKRGDAVCYLKNSGATLLVIVEGPMDALAAAMCGVSAVATLGVGAPGPVLAHIAMLAWRHKLRLEDEGYKRRRSL